MNIDERYSVSVIIAVYNQELNKILGTLKSVICQKRVNLQVIITDDGSQKTFEEEITRFLEKHGFQNYIYTASNVNQGTVKNFARCITFCEGDYLKLISPGDFLISQTILFEWISYMTSNASLLSFSDAFFYKVENNDIIRYRANAYPQNVKVYKNKDSRNRRIYSQLVLNDYWLGAAVIGTKSVYEIYFRQIIDRVKYAEDNIYRLATYDGVPSCYYNKETVFYETGAGVSSKINSDNKWHRALLDDWIASTDIMLAKGNNININKKLKYYRDWKQRNTNSGYKLRTNFLQSFMNLFQLYSHIPKVFIYHLKYFTIRRYTSIDYNTNDVMYFLTNNEWRVT